MSAGTGKFIEYTLPPAADPVAITPGPDGNFWFTEGAGKIGQITPAGQLTEYPLRTGAEPQGITAEQLVKPTTAVLSCAGFCCFGT